MRRVCGGSVVVATVVAFSSCSTPSPCEVATGTPVSQLNATLAASGYAEVGLDALPVLELIDVGHGSVEADGHFRGFDSCCTTEHPLADGGCAAACSPPTMEVYRLGLPYGEGSCPEQAEYGSGFWECYAYSVDGGVEHSSGFCVD